MNSGYRTTTSWDVTGLPTNGETIYARLATFYGSIEMDVDYTFTASTLSSLMPVAAPPCLPNNPGSHNLMPPVRHTGGSGLNKPAGQDTACLFQHK
jgi:hypothetical protein